MEGADGADPLPPSRRSQKFQQHACSVSEEQERKDVGEKKAGVATKEGYRELIRYSKWWMWVRVAKVEGVASLMAGAAGVARAGLEGVQPQAE